VAQQSTKKTLAASFCFSEHPILIFLFISIECIHIEVLVHGIDSKLKLVTPDVNLTTDLKTPNVLSFCSRCVELAQASLDFQWQHLVNKIVNHVDFKFYCL